MRTLFLTLGALLSSLPACSDSGPRIADDRQVTTLSDEEAQELCSEFFDLTCAGMPDIDSCLGSCADLCEKPEMPATMRSECHAPIIVGAVRECARAVAGEEEDAFEICTGEGMGGCVFDVGDLLCP